MALAAAVAVAAAGLIAVPQTPASAQQLPSPEAPSRSEVSLHRYAGADRYDTSLKTAAAFAERATPLNGPGTSGIDTVVIVSGRHWTDAVVAPAIAAEHGAPVLSVPASGLTAGIEEFIDDYSIDDAVVISTAPPEGSPTVPVAVDRQLRGLGVSVQRISGQDQYETALKVAAALDPESRSDTAFVASGEVHADSLSAGPIAYKGRMPMLLTPADRLHPGVAEWLVDSGIRQVIVLGGPKAVSEEVTDALASLESFELRRNWGVDRYATAAGLALTVPDIRPEPDRIAGCFGGSSAGLARGDVPFDALGSAPLLAQRCAVLLLSQPEQVPEVTADQLKRIRRGRVTVSLHVMGGPAAISPAAIDAYLDAYPPTAPSDKKYRNRSENSVLPATDRYFINHNEVATLFPQCPAAVMHPNVRKRLLDQIEFYSGFDTEVVTARLGTEREHELAVGWFTDDKIRARFGREYPGKPLTAEWAKANARQQTTYSSMVFYPFGGRDRYVRSEPRPRWPQWMEFPRPQGPMSGLWDRITDYHGYSPGAPGASEAHAFATPWGIGRAGRHQGANAAGYVRMSADWENGGGSLLFGWMYFMAQFPPLTHEPAAWGMFTLLDTYDARCVASEMLKVCDRPVTDATSAHLRADYKASHLGIVLRNLVCGEARTSKPISRPITD